MSTLQLRFFLVLSGVAFLGGGIPALADSYQRTSVSCLLSGTVEDIDTPVHGLPNTAKLTGTVVYDKISKRVVRSKFSLEDGAGTALYSVFGKSPTELDFTVLVTASEELDIHTLTTKTTGASTGEKMDHQYKHMREKFVTILNYLGAEMSASEVKAMRETYSLSLGKFWIPSSDPASELYPMTWWRAFPQAMLGDLLYSYFSFQFLTGDTVRGQIAFPADTMNGKSYHLVHACSKQVLP